MSHSNDLATLLAHEVDCLQRLLSTLELERVALTTADIDKLERITPAKNAAMAEQTELALQRNRFLADHDYDPSNDGLLACISASDSAAELAASLESLAQYAEVCQQLNRENGRLILQKQQHTQSALNILRQNADQGPTYSGRGLADSAEDSRTLGKA
ncbi:MAG: flagella synthesis protein FlgN [Halioglobus sp.]